MKAWCNNGLSLLKLLKYLFHCLFVGMKTSDLMSCPLLVHQGTTPNYKPIIIMFMWAGT